MHRLRTLPNISRQSLEKSKKFSEQITIKTHLLFSGFDCYLLAKASNCFPYLSKASVRINTISAGSFWVRPSGLKPFGLRPPRLGPSGRRPSGQSSPGVQHTTWYCQMSTRNIWNAYQPYDETNTTVDQWAWVCKY